MARDVTTVPGTRAGTLPPTELEQLLDGPAADDGRPSVAEARQQGVAKVEGTTWLQRQRAIAGELEALAQKTEATRASVTQDAELSLQGKARRVAELDAQLTADVTRLVREFNDCDQHLAQLFPEQRPPWADGPVSLSPGGTARLGVLATVAKAAAPQDVRGWLQRAVDEGDTEGLSVLAPIARRHAANAQVPRPTREALRGALDAAAEQGQRTPEHWAGKYRAQQAVEGRSALRALVRTLGDADTRGIYRASGTFRPLEATDPDAVLARAAQGEALEPLMLGVDGELA